MSSLFFRIIKNESLDLFCCFQQEPPLYYSAADSIQSQFLSECSQFLLKAEVFMQPIVWSLNQEIIFLIHCGIFRPARFKFIITAFIKYDSFDL